MDNIVPVIGETWINALNLDLEWKNNKNIK